MNGGNITNNGYSISLSGTPIRTKDIIWTLSAYYSKNFNKVTGDIINDYTYASYLSGSAIVKGEAIGTFYSYKYQGLSGTNGVPIFDDYQDRPHLLKDKPIEQVIQMAMENSGTREPFINGNLSSNFTYKQLSLNLNLSYSLGSKVRLFRLYEPMSGGVKAINNLRKEFTERWQNPGDEIKTDIPVIMSSGHPDYSNYKSHYSSRSQHGVAKFASNVWDMYDNANMRVVSGNYIKCQSISLRYNFNIKML